MHMRRPGMASSGSPAERVHQAISLETMSAARRHDVRARTYVFDKNPLQARRPRPELAHRQWCDRLERRDETVESLRIEPSGTAANQLARHGVDARQTPELV